MIEIVHTQGDDPEFRSLIALLDAELAAQYGALQRQYDKHNAVDALLLVVVARVDGEPAACGAFKRHGDDSVEIKRMFAAPAHRRQGLARRVLAELERAAGERGFRRAVLETGVKQTAAIALYQSMGYRVIENYGPYAGNENSVCMGKGL